MKAFPEQSSTADIKSTEQKIIELFRNRPGEIISGEQLASALDISRTAVWKHIRSLRARNYNIVSVPSRGYRLLGCPDILLPEEIASKLHTNRIGKKIICLAKTDSTNLRAFSLGEQGADEGTVVTAEEQTQGKGRLGRHWESPAGVNLYCSILLRPPLLPLKAPQFAFLSAVAVAKAIETTTSLKPRIKWPNDVLVNGYKVSGILNEMSAEMEKINFIILGVGVNINMRREQFPSDLRHPASSLMIEGGKPVNRSEFTRNFLVILDALYDEFLLSGAGAVREEWLSRSILTGKKVRVSFQKSETVGIACGLDDDGALLIRNTDGKIDKILAGDVSIEE